MSELTDAEIIKGFVRSQRDTLEWLKNRYVLIKEK
jgi:hypothetical protein